MFCYDIVLNEKEKQEKEVIENAENTPTPFEDCCSHTLQEVCIDLPVGIKYFHW